MLLIKVNNKSLAFVSVALSADIEPHLARLNRGPPVAPFDASPWPINGLTKRAGCVILTLAGLNSPGFSRF
jgi:hypothetical protein